MNDDDFSANELDSEISSWKPLELGCDERESGGDVFTAQLFKPTASKVTLKRSRASSAYIPKAALRSKRIRAELEADQDFLMQMRDIWKAKLQQLQVDERILESMASIPESAIQGARPLINQADYTQGFELAGGTSLRVQLDSVDLGSDRAAQQDSSAEESEEEEEDVEDVYWDAHSGVDDEEGEDEDAARRALTFMLAEFGDQLD